MTPTALVLASLSLSALFADLSGAVVVSDTSQATVAPALDRRGQALDLENLPFAELHLSWPQQAAALGYGPRFLLRDATEDDEFLLLHTVRASYTYTATRSRLALGFTGNFGKDSLTASSLFLPFANPDTSEPVVETPTDTTATTTGTDTAAVPGIVGAPAPEPASSAPRPLALTQQVDALSAEIRYVYSLPRWELSLGQSGKLSKESLAALALAAPLDARFDLSAAATPAEAIALLSRQRVKTGEEVTSAGLSHLWSRRFRSSLQLSYEISGGIGDEAEAVVPLQRSAIGSLGMIHELSRRDELTETASVTQTEVSNDTDHLILSLTEGWSRRWSVDVTTSVAVGLTLTDSREQADGPRVLSVVPTANAGVSAVVLREHGATLLLLAAASVSPSVDRFSAELQTRVGGTAGAQLRYEQLTLGVEGDAAQTLPPDATGASRVIGVAAEVSQRVEEFLYLSARYRSVWQDADSVVALGAFGDQTHVWSATLAATVVAPPLEF